MSELQVIESALERAARRRRWARALHGMWQGLLIGAILTLLLLGVYHLFPMPLWVLPAAAFVPLPCMLCGMLFGGWRRAPLNETARWVDGRLHLQERLSTALEVGTEPTQSRWNELVVQDAAGKARDLDSRQLVVFALPRITRWALLVLALGVGLGFVPEYRSKNYLQKQAEREVIKEAGRHLTDLTRHNLEKRPPVMESTMKAMEAVSDLGDQLTKKAITRTEALKELANVAEKLKDQLKDMGKDPTMKRLEQAARASTGTDSQTSAGMQKQMDALQKQLGSPTGHPEAMEKLKQQLEKLQQAAKGIADKNSGATEAEKQKLSESLSALSKQMQEMGLQLPQLDDAINALAANQTDLVLKDLEASLTDLEKMRDMAKSLQQLQQQMEKMGKDLAEQLKNGQPELAQSTLQKMADQLKSAQLPNEQLKKILGEVNKAIDPASNYGTVAERLKDASKQMQAGDKASASQALADAAKELGKLMQQMGDTQGLMAELDALNKASMCVGNCQGWRAGNRPGFGKGSKPGGGVGTWADDDMGWNTQFTEHWDNSGFVRPDLDPRGHTDRGNGDLSDALKPTKVKGQFSPGGQMPSITLKGISIKGQSKVAFEEASAAAQSDAQSALSQEKVPRAYQGAVKDYFDDFKK